jgi:dynein light chain Tctex-type 1
MADDGAEEFQVEDVEGIVKTSLQSAISQESKYDPETANTTSRTLLEACIKNLAALGKPFKYIVTAIVMQKNGAGLHTAMGAYWDARKDGALGSGRRRQAAAQRPLAAASRSSFRRSWLSLHTRTLRPALTRSFTSTRARRHCQGVVGERDDAHCGDRVRRGHCALAAAERLGNRAGGCGWRVHT